MAKTVDAALRERLAEVLHDWIHEPERTFDSGVDAVLAALSEEPTPICGPTAHGFVCTLPKGHNMGNADVPDNHLALSSPL